MIPGRSASEQMSASFRLGRILGIPVEVNITWILIFLLITYLVGEMFGQSQPVWTPVQLWSISLLTALLFFTSVLVHELTHSVVAVRMGIPVHKITLFIFGGVSQLAHESRNPRSEFTVAVVGPLSSLALSGIFAGLWLLLDAAYPGAGSVCLFLAWVNLSLAVFNMLPGFPLDGGRVLRSVVWGITGSYWRATQVAARGGQLLGCVMVAGGILMAVRFGGFQSAWVTLVGLFLFSAATSGYRHERIREGLRRYSVSDAMSRSWAALLGDTPLDSPVLARDLLGREQFVAVVVNGRIAGTLSRRLVDGIPRAQRPHMTLAGAMLPLAYAPQVSPGDSLADALEIMEDRGLGGMVVTDNGELVGLVTRRDILGITASNRTRRAFWRRR